MCGICGFISKKQIDILKLQDMNNRMIHRGPDDSGAEIYQYGDFYIGFAHRRLSINDLSLQGHQPMYSADRRIAVIFNGEIYNFKALKNEISEYLFRTQTDTEVIIAAYIKWGIRFVEKINGMYAIALYDKNKQKIYLIRDRVGKKPLYYFRMGEDIIFSSELKPILVCPLFKKRIREDVLSRYLYQGYINAPDSIYENVYKVAPGSIVDISLTDTKSLNMESWCYWDINSVCISKMKDPFNHYDEAKRTVKTAIVNAVKRRLIGDVPIGAFLSGGIDSTIVTAIAQEMLGTQLETFCIGFEDEHFNEAGFARDVAKAIGTKHREMIISEKQMLDLMYSIPQYFDEPFADSSQIPTMLVSELACENVTVVLTGDGGDEFFCGYKAYDSAFMAQRMDRIGNILWNVSKTKMGNPICSRLPEQVKMVMENRDPSKKVQFSPSILEMVAKRFVGEQKRGKNISYISCKYEERKYKDWRRRKMLLDMETYLPGDILCKTDRSSMRYSLEARCPILDMEVMETSFRIPMRYQYYHGDKKHILKEIAYEYVPAELLNRPKKGFGVPRKKWLQSSLKGMLTDYSDMAYLYKQGLFDAEYVCKFVRDYVNGVFTDRVQEEVSELVWSFLVFQIWDDFYKNYV